MASFVKQVRPVTEPSSIRGLPNGDYPVSSLVDITDHAGTKVGRLCREAARAWQAMVAHAWRDGIDLRPTSTADTFRPLAVQQRIFTDRYRTTDQGNGSRVCAGRRWYKRKGVATAACPGTSNHGKAIAIDIANCSGARLTWLEANAWAYGFGWELVPEEPWHLRYCTGDAIPAAVLKHEAKTTTATEEPEDVTRLIAYADKNGAAAVYAVTGNTGYHVKDGASLDMLTAAGWKLETHGGKPFGPEFQGAVGLIDGPCQNRYPA